MAKKTKTKKRARSLGVLPLIESRPMRLGEVMPTDAAVLREIRAALHDGSSAVEQICGALVVLVRWEVDQLLAQIDPQEGGA